MVSGGKYTTCSRKSNEPKAISRPDGQDTIAPKAPGSRKIGHHKNRRKPGPKKKHPREKADWMPNPFGKYPTSSSVIRYLEATKKYYAPTTQTERSRKTRYICRILTTELNGPKTPKNVTEKDIIAFLDWMDIKNLGNATQRRLLRYLRDYLSYYSNDVVAKMLSRRQIRVPNEVPPEVRSLSKETVEYIHSMTHTIGGWKGVVARFITMAYPYTGLRPSELRTMKYKDVDMDTWTLKVSHPKGEGRYGKHRRMGILPRLRPVFKEFILERKIFLEEHGANENFEALIPYKGRNGLEYWGSTQINTLKMKIEKRCDIKFKLKDYRATFCQLAIDLGAELQAVSKIMGHKTTMTTETYYGRIRDDTAIKEIERAFTEPDVLIQNTPELKISQ